MCAVKALVVWVLAACALWSLPAHAREMARIVYWTNQAVQGQIDIISVAVDGSDLTNLTGSQDGSVWTPEVSPDGQRVAFSAQASSGWREIWSLDVLGGSWRQVTRRGVGSQRPSWSPTGDQLAIEGSVDYNTSACDGHLYYRGCHSLYVVDVSTGEAVDVTQSPDFGYYASWSPVDDRIAYVREHADGAADLWTVRSNGTDPIEFDTGGRARGKPTWSTSGDTLAVSLQINNRRSEVWLFDNAGTPLRRLTTTDVSGKIPILEREPSWLTGTSTVALVAGNTSSNCDIWLADVDQGTMQRVTWFEYVEQDMKFLSWIPGEIPTSTGPVTWGSIKAHRRRQQ